MSVQAIDWARQQDVPSTTKFVLVMLANYADQEGACFPSQTTLAYDTGLHERTIRKHLSWLEDHGLIRRAGRWRDDGSGRSSDRIALMMPPRPVKPASRAGKGGGATGSSVHPTGSSVPFQPGPRPGEPSVEPSLEPFAENADASSARTASQTSQSRPRDHVFDALAEATGVNLTELTRQARGALNTAAKQLRDLGATPEEIRRRAIEYRRRHPDWALTATALVKWWPTLGGASQQERVGTVRGAVM